MQAKPSKYAHTRTEKKEDGKKRSWLLRLRVIIKRKNPSQLLLLFSVSRGSMARAANSRSVLPIRSILMNKLWLEEERETGNRSESNDGRQPALHSVRAADPALLHPPQ